jgi:heat shock protein HslJ
MNDRRRHPIHLGLIAGVLVALAACSPGGHISTPSPSALPSSAPSLPGGSASPEPSEGAGEGNGQLGNLAGTGWRVLRVDDVVPVAGSEPTIAFTNGQMEGTTGCNSYGGPVAIQGATFTAGDMTMTLVGCLDEIGEMETAFLRAIDQADSIGAEGANLVIRGAGGTILLRPDATVGG